MTYYKLTYPFNPNTYSIVKLENSYIDQIKVAVPLLDIQLEPFKITPRKNIRYMQITNIKNVSLSTEPSIAEIFALKALT